MINIFMLISISIFISFSFSLLFSQYYERAFDEFLAFISEKFNTEFIDIGIQFADNIEKLDERMRIILVNLNLF